MELGHTLSFLRAPEFVSCHHQHSGRKRPGFGLTADFLTPPSVLFAFHMLSLSSHRRKLLHVLNPLGFPSIPSDSLHPLSSLERPDSHTWLFLASVPLLILGTLFYFCAFDQSLLILPDSLSSGITSSCKASFNYAEKRYAQDLLRILFVASDRNANQTG